MLRLAGARLLDDRDLSAVKAVLSTDPVNSCMVSARVEIAGLDPWRLGGELWTAEHRKARHDVVDLCFAGANIIPLSGNAAALRSFAERALRKQRLCSSLVGPAEQVLGLWHELRLDWSPAREVREEQPLLALDTAPLTRPDSQVRRVRLNELDQYLPAAVAMFTEEVGIDPSQGDGGGSYRARVADLIARGHAFARFEDGEVVFKAEIGALSLQVGQIQGVWVRPDRRGHGLGAGGTAAVTQHLVHDLGRTASLYVNSYNTTALATYRKVGFRQVGSFATVLF